MIEAEFNLSRDEILEFRNIQLKQIPRGVITNRNISLLKAVEMENNGCCVLPAELKEFFNLQIISVRSNPIEFLPNYIYYFHNLKYLIIENCMLTHLVYNLTRLSTLRVISAANNQIRAVHPDIFMMPSLVFINLDNNQIRWLEPPSRMIAKLPYISLVNNPLEDENNKTEQLLGRKGIIDLFGWRAYFADAEKPRVKLEHLHIVLDKDDNNRLTVYMVLACILFVFLTAPQMFKPNVLDACETGTASKSNVLGNRGPRPPPSEIPYVDWEGTNDPPHTGN